MRRITQPVGAIRTLTLIGSTVTIILFFLASLAIVRQFTNPIRQIASQMRIARIGDWQPDLRVDGTDEIAYLSRQFVAMMERLQKLAAELVEEKTRLYRQEMEALQAQINPHFLFNTLDVVNWMASEHEVPPIAAIVRALSGMMRYALGRSGAPATLGAEMDYLTDYLHIQSGRFADRFSACVSVPDDLRGCAVPRLIVQPIVENAIRHGFRGLKRPGTITISATCHAGDLSITVADDGNGMSPETIARITGIEDPAAGERAGIGARNVDRRLKLAFGPGYGLRYRSVPGGGTSCTITLPDAGRVTCGR
jgi:two-component system sensor histidine kinase YesM